MRLRRSPLVFGFFGSPLSSAPDLAAPAGGFASPAFGSAFRSIVGTLSAPDRPFRRLSKSPHPVYLLSRHGSSNSISLDFDFVFFLVDL